MKKYIIGRIFKVEYIQSFEIEANSKKEAIEKVKELNDSDPEFIATETTGYRGKDRYEVELDD